MKKRISSKDVIRTLRLKSQELIKENENYEILISKNRDVIASLNKSILALGGDANMIVLKRTKPVKGVTFKEKVLEILADDRPRTSRQLYNDFIKVEENSKIKDFYGFSGRFANVTKSAGIKKHEIPDNPISKRFYYGKSEWFDGNRLKKEYFNKIIYDE